MITVYDYDLKFSAMIIFMIFLLGALSYLKEKITNFVSDIK